VEETRDLSALTTPSEFYQTQMVPETYQNSALVGTGEKIDSLMIRQYLRMGYAPALALPPREFGGGYTEARKTGVIAPVVKADVESLYPSIMLTQKIKPQSDTLNAFLPMLSELTHRRLEAKAQVKTFPEHSRERSYWDGLQSSFKVLINSFYGYVGGPFHFNDYEAASAVTEKGRELVKKIADEIERAGGEPIEIDTDGVYFKPPANVESVEDEELYIEQIGSVLPAGIRLAHDGRYRAMLSLKIKNYVLVDYTGKRIVRGSSLRSRADELFGREFLGKAIDLLLENKKSEIARLYSAEVDRILNGKLSLDEIVRRERVTAKMLTSSLRRRAASAIKSGDFKEGDIVYLYQRSDGALAVKEDYKNDEDRAYYVEKLHKFALRLSSALSANELAELFPSPTDRKARSLGAQTSLDL
jgi:DNA polymerase elongation subunit (family B)